MHAFNLPTNLAATFDPTGQIDYLNTFYNAVEAFVNLTVAAGTVQLNCCLCFSDSHLEGKRVPRGLVDATARHGYSIIGSRPRTPHEVASEYYQVQMLRHLTKRT